MRCKKQEAIRLRKKGKSYRQIKEILDIPKSTLSFWLRDIKLSDAAVEKLSQMARKKSVEALIKRNRKQTIIAFERAKKIRKLSSQDITNITKRELFLMGVSLYWAEGYKRGAEGGKWKCVDFSNSDSAMITLMMRFFREICNVTNSEFKIQLMLHAELNKERAVEHWAKVVKLPKDRFLKVSVLKSRLKKEARKLEYGTLHVRVYNTDLFHKIIGWIDGLKYNGV